MLVLDCIQVQTRQHRRPGCQARGIPDRCRRSARGSRRTLRHRPPRARRRRRRTQPRTCAPARRYCRARHHPAATMEHRNLPPRCPAPFVPAGTVRHMSLDLHTDPADLTALLVDMPSVSGTEGPLADAIEAALRGLGEKFEVIRSGNAVLGPDLPRASDQGIDGRAHRYGADRRQRAVPARGGHPARLRHHGHEVR